MALSLATEKSPVTPPGIDPKTVLQVAQCLTHYATPDPSVQYVERVIWYLMDNRVLFNQQYLSMKRVLGNYSSFFVNETYGSHEHKVWART